MPQDENSQPPAPNAAANNPQTTPPDAPNPAPNPTPTTNPPPSPLSNTTTNGGGSPSRRKERMRERERDDADAKYVKRRREDDESRLLKKVAWWFCRYYNPYINVHTVLEYGYTLELRVPQLMKKYEKLPAERDYLHAAYQALKERLQEEGIFESCFEGREDRLARGGLSAMFAQAFGNARSDDVGSLQKAGQGLRYLEPGVSVKNMTFDPDDFKYRGSRGFFSKVFAKWLCPHKYSEQFDADPEGVTKQLAEGQLDVDIELYPRIFYEEGQPYDGDDPSRGLLRSGPLVLVYKHIFTTPSSTEHASKGMNSQTIGSASRGQARLNNMSRTSGRDIVYAAMHLRHMCSSQLSWSSKDGKLFNLEQMFINLVMYFDEDEEWARETLDWWDMKIFQKASRTLEATASTSGSSDHQRMLARIAAAKSQARETPAGRVEPRNSDEPGQDPQPEQA